MALAALILSLIAAGCGGSDSATTTAEPAAVESTESADTSDSTETAEPADAPMVGFADEGCPTLTLVTHDSFAVSEGIFKTFTDDTCIEVQQVAAGDAGQMVSSAILTKDNPTADVMFGIDNTFLQRGLDQDLFLAYESPLLSTVDSALQLDPEYRVTPIDYGDVCVNYWTDALPGAVPTSLDDLIDPVNVDQFVTENPETSSPGFAFLLATIETYGDGWQEYWQVNARS